MRPTVTDADLVLGYLDAESFLGGRMRLDVEAARQAISRHVAEPLGTTVAQAAWAIHHQVNQDMAAAARVHAAERGHDPAGLPLFAFGGAGPVHAAGVAQTLASSLVVAAPRAGVLSAVGMLAAPLAFEFARSRNDVVDAGTVMHAEKLLREMQAEGEALLRASGVAAGDIQHERSADVRYAGQGFELRVGVPDDGDLLAAFGSAYERAYGRGGLDVPAEVLTWRVVSRGPSPRLRFDGLEASEDTGGGYRGVRATWQGAAFEPTAVFDRYGLKPGTRILGPAIVEERESTLVVPSRATCAVAPDGGLVIDLSASAS